MKPIQILRSFQRGEAAVRNTQLRFVLTILSIIAVVAVCGILTDPLFASTGLHIFAGTSIANMLLIGNVVDVSDRQTTGENIYGQVYLVAVNEQIDKSQVFPLPNAAREVGTLPMLSGQYMKYFEAHSFPEYTGTGEKGDVTSTGENNFSIIMAGMRAQLLNFAEQHVGDPFIIIFREVGETEFKILGSLDKPMRMSFDAKNNKDGRYVTYTFKRSSICQYYIYAGSLIVQAPAVHTASATTLALVDGQDVYDIPDGTAATYAINAVSGLTASGKGRILTLKGTGLTKSATIADGTVFTLEDGATWTAKAGSSIKFRVLDATTLVEVQGSRVQTA